MWRSCENVFLQIGDYSLKSHMYAIEMGGCEIIFGNEWLCTLSPITMIFQQVKHHYTLYRITTSSAKIINSHHMGKLLNKGHSSIIAQLNCIQSFETPYKPIHFDLQLILSKDQVVFDTPQGLRSSCCVNDHFIPIILSNLFPNVYPYHRPFDLENEIEIIVQELLIVVSIYPSTSPYSNPIDMVLKKFTWHMCPHLHALN